MADYVETGYWVDGYTDDLGGINVDYVDTRIDFDLHTWMHTWAALSNDLLSSVGRTLAWGPADHRVAQVFGVFGTNGALVIEGSMDGAHWATLTDGRGNALSITAAGIYPVGETTAFMRPRVSAGDGDTALTVMLMTRRF